MPSATTAPRPLAGRQEVRDLRPSDQPPDANVTAPGGSIVASTTFTITGTATDDVGVQSISYHAGRGQQPLPAGRRHRGAELQHFNVQPDVVGATSTTWSYDVDGALRGRMDGSRVTPRDTGGSVLPRHRRPHLAGRQQRHRSDGHGHGTCRHDPADHRPRRQVTPGQPMTFSGHATDDEDLATWRSSCATTPRGERLAADGTWNNDRPAGLAPDQHRSTSTGGLQLDLHHAVHPDARGATRSRSGRSTTSIWRRPATCRVG